MSGQIMKDYICHIKELDFYVLHRTTEEFEVEGLQVQLCKNQSRDKKMLRSLL